MISVHQRRVHSARSLLPASTVPKMALMLCFAITVAYGWFHNGANANQAARLNVIFSFVEPGTADTYTFHINRFKGCGPDRYTNTCDWANNPQYDRNFYSNKPPLPSIMGIPVYAVLYWLERGLGIDPLRTEATNVNSFIINFFVTVVPVALSSILFYLSLLTLCKQNDLVAGLGTFALYFGTLMFPFSTQLWGHTLAAAFCISGFFFLVRQPTNYESLSGLFFGLAVLCDYTTALTVAVVFIYMVMRRNPRSLARFCLGGLFPALIFAGYHKICFGSFFMPASIYSNPLFLSTNAAGGLFDFFGFKQAVFGLTFSSYRGLFWYMPVLCLFPLGLLVTGKLGKYRWVPWLALANIILFFVLNVSFNGWHGGWSTGPRYQIVGLQWYIILAAVGITHLQLPRPWIVTIPGALMLAFSVSNMLIAATVSTSSPNVRPDDHPVIQQFWSNPLPQFYKQFANDNLQFLTDRNFPLRKPQPDRPPSDTRSFIMGRWLGLHGKWQVAPVVSIMLFSIGILFYKQIREKSG